MSDDYEKLVQKWYGGMDHWYGHGIGSPDVEMLLPEYIVGKDVLDLGCSWPDKEVCHGAQARRWVAIDFVPDVIAKCKANWSWPSTVEFLVGDMRKLDFGDASFDTVCDFSSGDHITLPDYKKVLAETWRVLRPGGVTIIAYSNSDFHPDSNQLEVIGGAFGYERRCTQADMRAYLAEAGFQVGAEYAGNRSGVVARKASK